MKRGTITLAVICKNEVKNFPRFIESVKGCFDEIHITDTGSTDGTVEYVQELVRNPKDIAPIIKLKHFEWVKDFAAARNYSYKDVTTDYVMWMDLDDTLGNKEQFIKWRDVAMNLATYWLATYNYAYDGDRPIVSFMRERVISMKHKPTWQYFIHEGIPPAQDAKIQYATQWTIDHHRTVEDIEKDRGRNLAILQEREESTLPTRLKYYLGKEYFESHDYANAWRVLRDAVKKPDLDHSDRVLGLQYLASACLRIGTPQAMAEGMAYCHQGLQLDPLRAEYWCILGDSYLVRNMLREAISYYRAAESTAVRTMPGKGVQGVLHNDVSTHGEYPSKQIIKCLYNLGRFEEAQAQCEKHLAVYGDHTDVKSMLNDISVAIEKTARIEDKLTHTEDIVITTPPMNAYVWDDKVYKERGVGGSETAAIEMANWLALKTGRKVIIFNMRNDTYINKNGVEYRPIQQLNDYFSKFEPHIHIAWRHNIKVTNAKTYLWCHDLQTHGGENYDNFDYHLCLSKFHKDYLQATQGTPEEKMIITRNGINLDRFASKPENKNPYKIVWPSSPDRGLERAIRIVEKAREVFSDIELHVYYGLDNLKKSNHPHLMSVASNIEAEIKKHSWIKYHGNVQQDKLAQELKSAAVWLYPANFIESFCITALECLASKCYPLVRNIGALPNTLAEAVSLGQATVLDLDAETDEELEQWSDELIKVIGMKAWERINMDMKKHSWEKVAEEWIEFMDLKKSDNVYAFKKEVGAV